MNLDDISELISQSMCKTTNLAKSCNFGSMAQ